MLILHISLYRFSFLLFPYKSQYLNVIFQWIILVLLCVFQTSSMLHNYPFITLLFKLFQKLSSVTYQNLKEMRNILLELALYSNFGHTFKLLQIIQLGTNNYNNHNSKGYQANHNLDTISSGNFKLYSSCLATYTSVLYYFANVISISNIFVTPVHIFVK